MNFGSYSNTIADVHNTSLREKKKIKTSICSFFQFRSSIANGNQFIFAGCKHTCLFWKSQPQASFAVILNFNFLH